MCMYVFLFVGVCLCVWVSVRVYEYGEIDMLRIQTGGVQRGVKLDRDYFLSMKRF